MSNVWRHKTFNPVPTFTGTGCVAVIRRAAWGYSWKLMLECEMVASGTGRTRKECEDRVRAAKAARR